MPALHFARVAATAGILAVALVLGACDGARTRKDPLADIVALQDAGRFDESIEPLRALLARDAGRAEAHYRLGLALVRTGQHSLAVWPLEKAAASPDQTVPAGLLLADTFVGLAAYNDAIAAADRVLAADPSQLGALRARVQALLGANRREDAVDDAQRLYEAAPDDFRAGLLYATILAELGRHDDAEAVHAEIEQAAHASGDADLAVRACLARASFFEDHLEDETRAEAHFRTCLAQGPANPLALQLATRFFEQRGRPSESLAIWERAVSEHPDPLTIRHGLALRYEGTGEPERARALLTEGAALTGDTDAWMLLAEFERRQGRLDAALDAVARAVAASPSPSETLRFFEADLRIDAGQLEEAERSIATFEEEAYRALLEGRLLLARGDARAALGAFDRGLRRWPDNAGGRYLAGLAAREIGDFERAISEFREALRADPRATDAALSLGTLELARGHPRDAVEAASSFLEHRDRARPEAYRLLLRGLLAQGQLEAARRAADQLAGAGFRADAAIARAQIEAAASGPAAGVRSIEDSDLDPTDREHESVLRMLADLQIASAQPGAALAATDRALAARPDAASLHELRGAVLLRANRFADAQHAFAAALARDPGNARARTGLAEIAFAQGDAERAIALYDEAAEANADDLAPVYAAAQIALATGDVRGAKRRLETVVHRDPGHAGARNDLAWMLAQSRDELERALELATLAHRIDPNPDITDTLGFVHLQRGETARAIERFEEALAARPDAQSIRYHLGLALAREGERERAASALRDALASGPFPEAEDARRALAELEERGARAAAP